MNTRDYNFNNPTDVRAWGAQLCSRPIWRHPMVTITAKIVIGFFAVIGAGGFVMGMAQVLGL